MSVPAPAGRTATEIHKQPRLGRRGSPTTLEREIREQGDVLRRRLDDDGAAIAAAAEALRGASHVVIAARGTSDNVARYAQYLLGRELRLLVGLATPSLYGNSASAPDLRGAAVVAISQSGQSPDIVAVLAAARAQGRPAIALTNDPDSPLAAHADVVVPLLAGPERAVAATKTYTASLFAIAQLAEVLRPSPERPAALRDLPARLDGFVDEQLERRAQFDPLNDAELVTVLGRGFEYATAYETALKLREMTATPAEAFSPPDLLHGPIAAVSKRAAAWLVAAEPRLGSDLGALWRDLHARSRMQVAVAADPAALALADVAVPLPDVPEWAAPIVAIAAGQVAALRLAELRGVDADAPNGLHKVTLTT
jgi:glucosamine--fructose-6-phosphate aminotransferase (isomerizing)